MKGKNDGKLDKLFSRCRIVVLHVLQTAIRTRHACIWTLAITGIITTTANASPAPVQDAQTEQNTAEIAAAANTLQSYAPDEDAAARTSISQGSVGGMSFPYIYGAPAYSDNPPQGVMQNPAAAGYTSVFQDQVWNSDFNERAGNGYGPNFGPTGREDSVFLWAPNTTATPDKIPAQSVFKTAGGWSDLNDIWGHSVLQQNPNAIQQEMAAQLYNSTNAGTAGTVYQNVINPLTGFNGTSWQPGLPGEPNSNTSVFVDQYGVGNFNDYAGNSIFKRESRYGIDNASVFTTSTEGGGDGHGVFTAYNPDPGYYNALDPLLSPQSSVFTTDDNGMVANGTLPANFRQSVFLTNDAQNKNQGNSVFLDPHGNSYLDDLAANTSIAFTAGFYGGNPTSPATVPNGWTESYTPNGTITAVTNEGGTSANALVEGNNFTLAQIEAYASGVTWINSNAGKNGGNTYALTAPYAGLTAASTNEFSLNPQFYDPNPDQFDNTWWQWTLAPNPDNPIGYANRWAQAFYQKPVQNTTTGAWTMTPYLSALGGIDVTSTTEDQKTTDAKNAFSGQYTNDQNTIIDANNTLQNEPTGKGVDKALPYMELYGMYYGMAGQNSTGGWNAAPTASAAQQAFVGLLTPFGNTSGVDFTALNYTNSLNPPPNQYIPTIIAGMFTGIEWLRTTMPMIQEIGTILFIMACIAKCAELSLWAIVGGKYPISISWGFMRRHGAETPLVDRQGWDREIDRKASANDRNDAHQS